MTNIKKLAAATIVMAGFAFADNDKNQAAANPNTTQNVNVLTMPSVSIGNQPAVSINNPPAQPVPTKDQLNPALHPILAVHGTAFLANGFGNSKATYVPPAGQRAMIKNLGFICYGTTSTIAAVYIQNAQGENINWIPLQTRPFLGIGQATASISVDMMADSDGIKFNFQREPLVGDSLCEFGISGYLVP